MKILHPKEVKNIEQFFQLTQEQLLKAMRSYLKTKYQTVHSSKSYVMAIGDIPVALVAHLDTVFKAPPKNIYYDRVKNVMISPEGLGADDRAGVYAITQILKSGFRPTVIFTTDEEMGGIGATVLTKDFPKAPTDLKYIIELDRNGSCDCVFYSCDNPQFEEYVETFGFITEFGSFSDISVICPEWKVAGVNLSIGYKNEHSTSETLHIGHMIATINKVKEMLAVADDAIAYEYIEGFSYRRWFQRYKQENWYGYGSYANTYDPMDDYDPSYGFTPQEWEALNRPQQKCDRCGEWEFQDNVLPVKGSEGETYFFCPDCLSTHPHLHWCVNCGEAFIDRTAPFGKKVYCKDCRGSNNDSTKH